MDILVRETEVQEFVRAYESTYGRRIPSYQAAIFLGWRSSDASWGQTAIADRPTHWNEPITVPPQANYPEHWIVRFTERSPQQIASTQYHTELISSNEINGHDARAGAERIAWIRLGGRTDLWHLVSSRLDFDRQYWHIEFESLAGVNDGAWQSGNGTVTFAPPPNEGDVLNFQFNGGAAEYVVPNNRSPTWFLPGLQGASLPRESPPDIETVIMGEGGRWENLSFISKVADELVGEFYHDFTNACLSLGGKRFVAETIIEKVAGVPIKVLSRHHDIHTRGWVINWVVKPSEPARPQKIETPRRHRQQTDIIAEDVPDE